MNQQISIEELCKKLRPVIGNKADALYFQYAMASDLLVKRQIEQAINALYSKHVSESLLSDDILLEPPLKDNVGGSYPIAKVRYGHSLLNDFCLREKDFVRHICITGMSGSGKTNLALNILTSLSNNKKPFLVFDWKKSFRPLLSIEKNILCFTIANNRVSNNFKININRPPKGVSAREWLNLLCDLITESFAASYGVHKLISETMDRAFNDFGVYNGSENYPTWLQIKDRLEEKLEDMKGRKTRESEWLISALRVAHILTFGEFSEVINNKEKPQIGIEELFSKNVIFELDVLGNSEKRFFCSFILAYLYKYSKSNLQGTEEFRHAIVVDEAHNIFLKQKPVFVQELITEVIYREIREYGVSLICLDQHCSKLSDVVAGNSACNIAFQQMLPADIEAASSLMLLKEKKKYFSMLPVGSAIVKLAERHYTPFLIEVQLSKLKKVNIGDNDIRARMAATMASITQYKELSEGIDVKALRDEMSRISNIMNISGVSTKEADRNLESAFAKMESHSLTTQQKEFIQHLKKYPQYGTAQAYKALSISARQGDKIKNELIGLGLIEVEEVRYEKGWKKILKPKDTLTENPGTCEMTA